MMYKSLTYEIMHVSRLLRRMSLWRYMSLIVILKREFCLASVANDKIRGDFVMGKKKHEREIFTRSKP